MSIRKIDGFDGYGTPANQTNFVNRMYSSGWSNGGFAAGLTANTRTGIGFAIETGFYGDSSTAFDLAQKPVVGFAYNPGGLRFAKFAGLFYDNYIGGILRPVTLYINPTGAISVFDSTGGVPGTLVGHTPVNSIYAYTWHYIEIGFDKNTRSIEIRVDGNTVGLFTGSALSIPGANGFTFFGGGVGVVPGSFDDFYVLERDGSGHTDFLGDCVVHTVVPLDDFGPNDANQFGGGITHASAVNAFPLDQNSSYLYSNTVGDEELFTITELPADMIDILAMQVNIRSRKDSAGVAHYKISLKSGATLAHSSDITPTTSFLERSMLLEEDPNGGAWTKISAQAAKIGFKVS